MLGCVCVPCVCVLWKYSGADACLSRVCPTTTPLPSTELILPPPPYPLFSTAMEYLITLLRLQERRRQQGLSTLVSFLFLFFVGLDPLCAQFPIPTQHEPHNRVNGHATGSDGLDHVLLCTPSCSRLLGILLRLVWTDGRCTSVYT